MYRSFGYSHHANSIHFVKSLGTLGVSESLIHLSRGLLGETLEPVLFVTVELGFWELQFLGE